MQLSLTKAACLPESDGLHHLGTAERMLNSCRTELRRCIWYLRNDALDRPTFDEALSKALVPAIGRAKLTVDFKVPRSRISDTTAHSIICIVRELAANAARHRAAGAIAVQLGVSADCIKQHLNAIFHKLGAATRSEAVAIALRKQLIKS